MSTWLSEYHKKANSKLNIAQANIETKLSKLEEEATFLMGQGNASVQNRLAFLAERTTQEHRALKKILEYKKPLTFSFVKKEFLKLASHPKIDIVEVDDKGLILNITTKKLTALEKNIGHYKISLRLTSSLVIKNLEYAPGALDHWFVSGESPCLGTWRDVIQQYYDTGHIFLAVDTIFHFLLSTNDEHAFCNTEEWIRRFTNRDSSERDVSDALNRRLMRTDEIAAENIRAGDLIGVARTPEAEAYPPSAPRSVQEMWRAIPAPTTARVENSPPVGYGTAAPVENWLYNEYTAT